MEDIFFEMGNLLTSMNDLVIGQTIKIYNQ